MEISAAQSKEELLALLRQMQAIIAEQATALKQANTRIAELEQEIVRLKAGGGGSNRR